MWIFKMQLKKSDVLIDFLCFIIGIISAIDLYWIGKTRSVIAEHEQNPFGTYLIGLDGGDVSLFILCKFLGTYVAVATIYYMNRTRPNRALFVAASLAIAQLFLLAYLYYGLALSF